MLWFTNHGIVFDITRRKVPQSGRDTPYAQKKMERLVFNEELSARNDSAEIMPCDPQPGTYNYFLGNDRSKWQTGIRSYSELVYRNVWPGIDVRFVAKRLDVEQEFLVHAGADPGLIRVRYTGINKLKIDRDGSLAAITPFGHLLETAPVVYQENGSRVSRDGRFELEGEFSYVFRIGSFDGSRDLVVDPTLLYSTYLGGNNADSATGIATDSGGNAYIAGYTASSNFLTTPGVIDTIGGPVGQVQGFVTKLSPAGLPVYSTFISNTQIPGWGGGVRGIAVDSSGDAYITGVTDTTESFPTTPNAYSSFCPASTFLAKLNPTGESLLYSTCLGGEGYAAEYGIGANAVAVDSIGRAYVTGSDTSGAAPFPTTPGAYQSKLGDKPGPSSGDAFLSVIDPSLSGSASLVYSTFLGGAEGDIGTAVAVDLFGNAYIAGYTRSRNFPITTGAFQTSNKAPLGRANGFVAKFKPTVVGVGSLIYSTYLGGNTYYDHDLPAGIAVDSSGNAYVVGTTGSTDFRTTPGSFEPRFPSSDSGFIAKLDAGGSHLVYSSFIGTASNDGYSSSANGIALDPFGNAYIVGSTSSKFFPVTSDAVQHSNHGGRPSGSDAFLMELDPRGEKELYGSYLGGTNDDHGTAIAIDSAGDVYLAGSTISIDFPITAHAFHPTNGGGICDIYDLPCPDAFITKFPLGAPGALAITAITPRAGGNAGTVSPQIFGSGFHAGVSAKLVCGGSEIVGTKTMVSGRGQLLNATFDLTKTEPGACDVVVTNVDGTSSTSVRAFNVQEGGAPSIQLSVSGVAVRQGPPEIADAPTNAVFSVTVQNTGNIDSSGGILSLPFNSPFAGTSADPADLAPQMSPFEIWAVSPLPAGSAQNLTATATTIAAAESVENSTITRIAGLGSAATGATITYPGCTMVSKIDACYYPNPSVSVGKFLGCLTDHATYERLGIGLGCAETIIAGLLTCTVTAPFISFALAPTAGCFAAALTVAGGICAFERSNPWRAIPYCLNAATIRGPVCNYGPIHCWQPSDPNSLTGPEGVGSQRWISAARLLTYLITFENKADATAPAQKVIVTQPLSATLDLSKLGLLTITVPNGTSAIPVNIPAGSFDPFAGLNEFVTNVDLRPTQDMLVNVDAKLDPVGHTLIWTFTTIDPLTGQLPLNPLIGFLQRSSSGSVGFNIAPNSTAATDSKVSDQATILFIGSSPMSTPVWANTIDNTSPLSKVTSLPATESGTSFSVSWSGTDDGSGVQGFTVYVSDNGGPFKIWLTNTASMHATYTGTTGHTYGFYTIARDLVGNIEGAKTTAEATTTVTGSSSCATDISSQVTITRGGFRFDHGTNSFVQSVNITNNGAALSNAALVLDGLPSTATLSNSGGSTRCDAPLGSPWIAIPGTLGTGQSVAVNLTFSDPTKASINYSTRVLAGAGQK